jgi:SAM-dependent methyltransferase
MSQRDLDKVFAGSIPKIYDTYLVPLLFEPYADDLAARVAALPATRVLEIAAGTGVVTRRMASTLGDGVAIVATDLNQAMLDHASAIPIARPVEWRQADAMQLPFDDGAFDAVVCQFGVMFFPDKPKAFAEARRVLKPGGTLLFSVWDRIEDNDVADATTSGLASRFPADPPRFLPRTPYGYYDHARLASDLAAGGFSAPAIDVVTHRSRAASARDAALGFCQGSPLRAEIEARDPSGLEAATDAAGEAVAARLGSGTVDGKMQAIVVTVTR